MSYIIEPNNKFMQAAREIAEHESNPGVEVEMRSLVDLTEVEEMRVRSLQLHQFKPSYTAFVVKAISLALKEFPQANRRMVRRPWLFFMGPRIQAFSQCDISVVAERTLTGTEHTSLVDIIRSADQKPLSEINSWLQALAKSDTSNNEQWRQLYTIVTKLPTWLSALLIRLPVWVPSLWVKYRGAAVLITSPAKYGADEVSSHWTSPLGFSFGLVKKRPVVVNDAVVARPTFTLLLHFDRCIMHGSLGAKFFQRIVDILEHAHTEIAAKENGGAL